MSWRGRSRMDKGGLASQICNENYDEGCETGLVVCLKKHGFGETGEERYCKIRGILC
jgi:hypothetical protein